MSDHLISTTLLAETLGSPDTQVVDATWFLPTDGRSGRGEYERTHIPGAIFFDIDAISDPDSGLPHMLPDPRAFAQAAADLGLRRDATIVVYDHQGIFSAPRVWWTLRVMGFPKVFVLDGGLLKWTAEHRPVESGAVTWPPSALEPMFDADLVRDLDAVRHALDAGAAQVVDARAAERFRGAAPEPRPGLRAGHMPGALNLPWTTLVNPGGVLKAEPELRAAFEGAGVDLARPIITSCGSGVSASILALALARLGREDIPVYDGSWTEWGSRPDLPLATGA